MSIAPKDVPVVILAGGRGIRLSELTGTIPKPMARIGEHPLLLHIMRYYASYGFCEFVICLGYLGRVIKSYFLDSREHTGNVTVWGGKREPEYEVTLPADWVIHLVDTGEHASTATRVARAAHFIDAPHFCLTYGDGLTDLPLDAELAFHLKHGGIGTVAAVHPPARFGNLEIDPEGVVRNFQEKQPLRHDWINGGYLLLKREFLARVSAKRNESLESRPLQELAADGQLCAFRHSGFWQCMDTVRDLELLRELYESGRAAWLR